MICIDCRDYDEQPCCDSSDTGCEPDEYSDEQEDNFASCIHCYAGLQRIEGEWYHHTQVDEFGKLIK